MWVYVRDFFEEDYDVFPLASLLGGLAFWLLLPSALIGILELSWNGNLKRAGIAIGVLFVLCILLLLTLWKTKIFRFYKTNKMNLSRQGKETLQQAAQRRSKGA